MQIRVFNCLYPAIAARNSNDENGLFSNRSHRGLTDPRGYKLWPSSSVTLAAVDMILAADLAEILLWERWSSSKCPSTATR